MKLSEAIQLGSTLQPQTFGPFSDCHGTCAMGAALDAVGQLSQIKGKRNTAINEKRIRKIWPWLNWRLKPFRQCPWCGSTRQGRGFADVFYLIVHLNDQDKLSRPKIAYLIFQIELRAICHIDKLVPEYQKLRLGELEANLAKTRTKKRTQTVVEELQVK